LRLFLCLALFINNGKCDISEYFEKLKSDAQMDFFQKMPPQTYGMESRSPPDVDFSDYYDYFGIEPSKEFPLHNNIEDKEDELNVAADVLSNVKKPSSSFHKKSLKIKNTNSRYPYKKRNPVHLHRDNIAIASNNTPPTKIMTKRVSRPKAHSKSDRYSSKKPHLKTRLDDISSKVQRLVPSKIKTVIEGGGKKIVKTVLQPVQKITDKIKNRVDKGHDMANEDRVESVESWFSPYRTYLDGITPLFESQYVTHQLVATWINAIASSVVWVFLGHFFTSASGRSFSSNDEGRSSSSSVFPEVIEELVPDSDTVAMVLGYMATAAEKWHDEL